MVGMDVLVVGSGGQVGSCRLVDGIGFTVAEVCGIPDGRDGERRRRVCFTRSHRS